MGGSVWQEDAWGRLFDVMCTGFDMTPAEWGKVRYYPNMVATYKVKRDKATDAQWKAAQSLAGRALSEDAFLKHTMKQPIFHADEVLAAKHRKKPVASYFPDVAFKPKNVENGEHWEDYVTAAFSGVARTHFAESKATGTIPM